MSGSAGDTMTDPDARALGPVLRVPVGALQLPQLEAGGMLPKLGVWGGVVMLCSKSGLVGV